LAALDARLHLVRLLTAALGRARAFSRFGLAICGACRGSTPDAQVRGRRRGAP
jgi:hypothetical protein